jgi:hypothetical protein
MLLGGLNDIYINKIIGLQHCSFADGEQNCTIYGYSLKSWQRETLRVLLQLLIVFCMVIYVPKYITNQLYLNLSMVLFLISQTYLFDDFRRLLAGTIFKINYSSGE